MSKINLSTFWGDNDYSTRMSIVYKDNDGFLVEFYNNDELIETRELYDHSEIYAENAAENWVIGVIR